MRSASNLISRKTLRAVPGMAAAVMAGSMATAVPAKAQLVTPVSVAIAAMQSRCQATQPFTPDAPASRVATTKAEAILGGAPSALERIRMQQAGIQQAEPVAAAAPALNAPIAADAGCIGLKLALPKAPAPSFALPQASASDENFLASSRIAIRKTSFSDQWDRVSGATITPDQANQLVGTQDISEASTLQSINGWVNQTISYAEDRKLWNSRDYWATASQTLALGEGDCEDIAILKYQMLRALGVAQEDMFLTLARDLARNADHAVLVVRHEGRFFLLDNATDAILPANLSYDYRPTLSFSGNSSFLHGVVRNPEPRWMQLSFGQRYVEAARDRFEKVG